MSDKRSNDSKWDTLTDAEDTYSRDYQEGLTKSARSTPESSGYLIDTVTRRRGRGPSKRPCQNRNAQMARQNRLRKKAYLEKIEHKLLYYQQENKNLVNIIRKQSADVRRLSGEVTYLKSILNNNTTITTLLKTINEGLCKLQCHKNDLLQPEKIVHLNSGYSETVEYTNLLNTKVKTSESDDVNSYMIFNNNGHSVQHAIIQKGSNRDERTHVDSVCSVSKKNMTSLLGSDHTYTMSKNSLDTIRSDLESKDIEIVERNTISSFYDSLNNDYVDNGHSKEFYEVKLAPHLTNQLHFDEKKNMDFNHLPPFNSDIFADLPKCDEAMTMIDNFHDVTTFTNEVDTFQTLDNAGICLHVNSDKVSLEFCAICHANSKNFKLD